MRRACWPDPRAMVVTDALKPFQFVCDPGRSRGWSKSRVTLLILKLYKNRATVGCAEVAPTDRIDLQSRVGGARNSRQIADFFCCHQSPKRRRLFSFVGCH